MLCTDVHQSMLDLQHERQIEGVIAHAQSLLKPLRVKLWKKKRSSKNNTEKKRAVEHWKRAVYKGVLFAGDKERTYFDGLAHRWVRDGEYRATMEANSFTIEDIYISICLD